MELGKVTGTEIKRCGSAPGRQIVATVKGFTSQTAEVYNPHGLESNPPNGMKLCIFPLLGGKTRVAVGGANYQLEPDTEQGGAKLYSTDKDGKSVRASVLLKPDGSIEISADGAISVSSRKGLELSASGKIAVKNTAASLRKVLNDLAEHVKTMQTTPAVNGKPCEMGPATIAQLEADIIAIQSLLED